MARWRNGKHAQRVRGNTRTPEFVRKADSQQHVRRGSFLSFRGPLSMTLWEVLKKQWIANKNPDDFRRKLADEKDPDKRPVLAELVGNEERRLRGPHAERN